MRYYGFECPIGSLIFCVGHRFYFPKIVRLLAEWREVGVYSIANKFSEGSPPIGPFSLPPLHANCGDLGLFPRTQYILCVGLVRVVKGKKDSASPW